MHLALTPLSPALSLRGLAMLASLATPAGLNAPEALAAGFIVWVAAFACRFDAYYEVLRWLDDGGARPVHRRRFVDGSLVNATNGRGPRRGWCR
jgi:hypothetical protein